MAGASVVGQIDNERPSSRTYATATPARSTPRLGRGVVLCANPSSGRRAARPAAPLLRFVHLSTERTLEPVRKDCSFAESSSLSPRACSSSRAGAWRAAGVTPAQPVKGERRTGRSAMSFAAPGQLVERRLAAGAFLDACEEPTFARISLQEAPSVLGWQRWREIDAQYSMGLITGVLMQGIQAGELREQPDRATRPPAARRARRGRPADRKRRPARARSRAAARAAAGPTRGAVLAPDASDPVSCQPAARVAVQKV